MTSNPDLSPRGALRLAKRLARSALGRSVPPASAPAFAGNVDVLTPLSVVGWIARPGDGAPLRVDILSGRRIIAQGLLADNHRQDVQDAGFGSGRHGFSVAVTGAPLDPAQGIELRLSATGEVVLRRAMTGAAGPVDADPAAERPAPGRAAGGAVGGASGHRGKIERLSPTQLRGWAVDGAHPGRVFDSQLLIDGIPLMTVRNDRPRHDLQAAGLSAGLGGVDVALPLGLLEAGEHVATLRLPDGGELRQTIKIAQQQQRPALNGGVPAVRPADVAVIVPVWNAADDVATCIERLERHTPPEVEVLFIDDASPDPAIAPLLAGAAARRPATRVLRNAQNMGFTRTVNRGLEEIGRKHAVLLNSDARVTPDWIEGMLEAAASRPRVATVTAMSDRAGAFSAPRIGNDNDLPPGLEEDAYARAFRRRSLRLRPVVPTGNGFCMFVNRACIDEIGALDAGAFPRGYGEENDFCMRARRAGWANLVDDATYVFHERSRSFGQSKTELMAAGRAVIEARYPEYGRAIRVFSEGADLHLARWRAAQALADCNDPAAGLPAMLFVVSTQSGGTPQTNLDLMRQLGDEADLWLLRCDSRALTLSRLQDGELVEMRSHRLGEAVDPITHGSAEYDAIVADWLGWLRPCIVHIRHLAWHSLQLPTLARDCGARVVMSFHDFYALCPTVKLLDERRVFCGGRCTATPGDCAAELWPPASLPPLKHRWVHVWQGMFNRALAACDAFITTSPSARATLLAGLPGVSPDRFHVIPHGRNFARMDSIAARPAPTEPIRILLPGNIGVPKGRDILAALLDHDGAGRMEFHVLGKISDAAELAGQPRLFLHGEYKRDEFAARAAAIRPHLGAIFSIWDETWCHTLTELWSAGLPALVFDFPNVAARVRESGAGWVVPHQDVAALHDAILAVAENPAEMARAAAAAAAWQQGTGIAMTTPVMAQRYRAIYRSLLRPAAPARPVVAVVAPAFPLLDTADASRQVRLRERTVNHPDRPVAYVRMSAETAIANLSMGSVDGVIVQRTGVPPELTAPLLAALERQGIRHLHDLSDDLLNMPADKDPDGTYAAASVPLARLVAAAGAVTTSTEALAARLAAINPAVHVLPDRLSGRLWRGTVPGRAPDGMVRAFYMGTSTHAEDLAAILPALEALAAREAGFRLAVIGIQDAPLPSWAERVAIPKGMRSHARFVGWLRAQAGRFDFGLAPLARTAFNLRKSDLKVMEYGALGLPVLASDLPVYADLGARQPGVTLVPADGWAEALEGALAQARSGDADRRAIRAWTMQHMALDPTLADFDALVLRHVRAAAGPGAAEGKGRALS
ncbi:glycosyltransferase [Paracoccus contaminans]|uniref:Uncharacterized protein n=1 Tax=Paracoccus contaminans TaxID=1945662 RepID=A0A1W6CWZ4_9RHOB|nr:glycosyltransferase [Paracoccus contaminans]ARJ69299.1 hypothetical protein B0A89_06315 [Paracoccus contaminans]